MPSLVLSPGISSKGESNRALRELMAEQFLREDMFREWDKWTQCGKKAVPFKCLDCGLEYYAPFRCDLRICPECNSRYAGKFKARYFPVIKELLKRKRGRDRLMLLTVTTKNTGEIPETAEIKAHNKAIAKIIRGEFKGGVSTNEVKESFLHSHCIVFGPYVPQEKLSRLWEAETGAKVVDIREIKQTPGEVVDYVCKYLKKPYRWPPSEDGCSRAIQFLENFKGVRRVHSFGVFYARKAFTLSRGCPFCGSTNVQMDAKRFADQWTVTMAQVAGMRSYREWLMLIEHEHSWEMPTGGLNLGYA